MFNQQFVNNYLSWHLFEANNHTHICCSSCVSHRHGTAAWVLTVNTLLNDWLTVHTLLQEGRVLACFNTSQHTVDVCWLNHFPMDMGWVIVMLWQCLEAAAVVLSYSWGVIRQQWPHSDSASFSRPQDPGHAGMYSKHSLWNTPDSANTHTQTQIDREMNIAHTDTNTHTNTSVCSSSLPPETTLHAWLPAVKTLRRESILLQTYCYWY